MAEIHTVTLQLGIRRPEQKPLAACRIFVSVFVTAADVFHSLLAWLALNPGVGSRRGASAAPPAQASVR